MKLLFLLTVFIYSNALADKKQVQDSTPKQGPIIGKIFSIIKPPFLMGQKSEEITEHQKIITVNGEVLKLVMEDGTELLLGPNSEMIFTNWTKISDDGRLIRSLQLIDGFALAHVRKVYSQEEPFLVETPEGVVAVRGTEFVVESVGHYKPKGDNKSKGVNVHPEVDVHTLEGEVTFAKTRKALEIPKDRVTISAGRASLLQPEMLFPKIPHLFNLALFQKYFNRFIPDATLTIHHHMTPEKRANFAIHTGEEPFAGRSIASGGMEIRKPKPKPHQIVTEKPSEKE